MKTGAYGPRCGSITGLALLLAAAFPSSVQAQVNRSWRTAANGNWGVNSNWSPTTAFPNNTGSNTYNARVLLTTGAYTVMLDQGITVSSTRIESNTATLDLSTRPLSVLGTYTQFGSNLLGSPGATITVGGSVTFADLNARGPDLIGQFIFNANGTLSFASASDGTDICDTGINHAGAAMSWSGNGDIRLENSADITLGAASTWTISNDRSIFGSGASVPTIHNGGTILKSGGAGTTAFSGIELFNDTGTVHVATGTLSVNGYDITAGTLRGTWTIDNGATLLLLDDSDVPVTITTNAGTVTLDGASSSFGSFGPNLVSNDADGSIGLLNGQDLAIPGGFTSAGDISAASSASDTSTVTVGGALTQTDGVVSLSGAVVDVATVYSIGTLGTLKGTGTIDGTLQCNGKIEPGFSPGTLEVNGNLGMGNESKLIIEIGPDDPLAGFDSIQVHGSGQVDGMLEIRVLAGFVLHPGQVYDVLVADAGRIGMFETVESDSIPAPTANNRFEVQYLPDRVRLVAPGPVVGGGCCLSNGDCQLVIGAAQCSQLGGQYQGDGTACGAGQCPPPTGACCTPSGVCQALTQQECLALGGSYLGDTIPCSPGLICAPATGACCLPTRVCDVMSRADCRSLGGNYAGDSTVCSAETCCADDRPVETRADAEPNSTAVVLDGVVSPNEYGPLNQQVFVGGGNSFGGAVGLGAVYMDRDPDNLYIGLEPWADLTQTFFMFLDTADGGQTDASMTDSGNFRRRILANLTRSEDDIFPASFFPDYGLTIGSGGIHLYRLDPPDDFTLVEQSATFGGTGATAREYAISLSDIGSPGQIDFFCGYSRSDNFMSDEAIPAQPFSFGGSIGFAFPSGDDRSFVDWCRFDRFLPTCGEDLQFSATTDQTIVAMDRTVTIHVDQRRAVAGVVPSVVIGHQAVGNLTMTLTHAAPDGTSRTATLCRRINSSAAGGSAGAAGDLSDLGAPNASTPAEYRFNDGASVTLWTAAVNTADTGAVAPGEYHAVDTGNTPVSLASVFAGRCTEGDWTLRITDHATTSNNGRIVGFGLRFVTDVCTPCGDGDGACCINSCACQEMTQAECLQAGGVYQGAGTVCGTEACRPNPECDCDWNGVGGLDSQDFFDFLDDFFLGNADTNCSGTTDSQDYFDFMDCFFSGCGWW